VLTFYVIVPVLIAAFLYIASTNITARVLAIVFQVALFAAAVYLVMVTRDEKIVTYIGGYAYPLGISLIADSLSADFVLITAFIFLMVSIYSYKDERNMPLAWFLLFLIEAALIGLFLAGDLFTIFVLVEVSTVVTLLLAMFDRHSRKIFDGMVFLMVNIVAATLYLFGLGFVYYITGVLDMRAVAGILAETEYSALVLPYVLIMTSIAFKCALIPFFSWSPKVRIYPGAPTAVQAILSGLQIKAAVFLFLQFQEMFAPIAATEFFLVVGIISALFGAFMAICQTDIRLILAYHTVSQVGLIITGVSLGTEHSYIGGLYHIFSHAVFKTALFLCAGAIIHAYKTDNIYKIRGVLKKMPVVGVSAAAAVLGISGAPLFIGSVSKYFISYELPLALNIVTILISLGTIISFVKFSTIFFGEPTAPADGRFPSKYKKIPVVVLGILCLAGGIFGTQAIYFLFRQQVTVVVLSYIQKSLIFVVSVAVGWIIYKKIISGNKRLQRLGEASFSFKSVSLAIGVFAGVLLVYVGYVQ
jgi:multicomponent Na+:H+ antiporter subunit D